MQTSAWVFENMGRWSIMTPSTVWLLVTALAHVRLYGKNSRLSNGILVLHHRKKPESKKLEQLFYFCFLGAFRCAPLRLYYSPHENWLLTIRACIVSGCCFTRPWMKFRCLWQLLVNWENGVICVITNGTFVWKAYHPTVNETSPAL